MEAKLLQSMPEMAEKLFRSGPEMLWRVLVMVVELLRRGPETAVMLMQWTRMMMVVRPHGNHGQRSEQSLFLPPRRKSIRRDANGDQAPLEIQYAFHIYSEFSGLNHYFFRIFVALAGSLGFQTVLPRVVKRSPRLRVLVVP